MQSSIPLRLLEVNSSLIWHWPYLQSVIAVMIRDQFNGLIINQQNLLSLLVPPSKYCQHGRENLLREHQEHLLYLQRVCRYCQASGIGVWLQGEALPRDGKIQEKYPEYALIDNISADEIFWKNFYQLALFEALEQLPGIDGMIVNLHRHQPYKASWVSTIPFLYQTLRSLGKKMVLRDYMEDEAASWQLVNALQVLPPDVRVSIKAVAHGYRPGFVNNPLLTQLEGRVKWIEFDMWGLEYGWTLLPCYLLEEIQGRLSWVESMAGEELEAITGRLSWEWISNSSLINSVNSVNLHGLAMFGREIFMSEKQAFHCWLTDMLERKVDLAELNIFHQLYACSYEWMRKTPYILGHVLHHFSQVPVSYAQAVKQLQFHLLKSDDYAATVLFPINDPNVGREQFQQLVLEKERAMFLAQDSRNRLFQIIHTIDMSDEKKELFKRVWDRVPYYTEMFNRVARSVAMKIMVDRYGHQSGISSFQLNNEINELRLLAIRISGWIDKEEQQQPHYLAMLFDPARLLSLAESLTES
ncbi:hypothetical protein AAEU41_02730 [Pantoea agglomerans]